VIEDARDHGLLLLNCGPHQNVVRLLPPLTADADMSGAASRSSTGRQPAVDVQ
jgi:4-aminobutyrate aminotransferase-like enzyme